MTSADCNQQFIQSLYLHENYEDLFMELDLKNSHCSKTLVLNISGRALYPVQVQYKSEVKRGNYFWGAQ